MKSLLQSVLRRFPPVEFVFAYGSGVLKQQGREMGKMVDLIFVVDTPRQWHSDNIMANPSHYSFLRYLGANAVTNIQRYPAAIYYNTLVNIETDHSNQLIKYGVISTDDFYSDLIDWQWLYTSGRLQKPGVHLNMNLDNAKLSKALQTNYQSAMLCALLLMDKKSFSLDELFVSLTGISYIGDFRMIIGEDKNKIKNIVTPAIDQFTHLYSSLIHQYLEPNPQDMGTWILKEDLSIDHVLPLLPLAVRNGVSTGKSLKSAISSIVAPASIKQGIKGLATAGIVKSIEYSGAKLVKMFRSL